MLGVSLSPRSGIFLEDGDGEYFFSTVPVFRVVLGVSCVPEDARRVDSCLVSSALEEGHLLRAAGGRRTRAPSRERTLVVFVAGPFEWCGVEWSGEKKTRISRVSAIHSNI